MLINRDVRIIRFEFESLLYELFENFESVADIIRVLILRLSQIISQNANAVLLLIYNILKLNLVYNILKNEFKTVSNKNRL